MNESELIRSSNRCNLGLNDSIGVESKTTSGYIVIHKVDPKESFFSIARKYKALMVDIKKENPGVTSIKVGQIIRVPVKRTVSAAQKATQNPAKSEGAAVTTNPAKPTRILPKISTIDKNNTYSKTHIVEAGQSLLSIARKYNVSMGQLRGWNSITNDKLIAGQKLIVTDPSARPSLNNLIPIKEDVAVIVASKPVKETIELPAATTTTGNTTTSATEGFEKIKQTGIAEMIEDETDSKKHLCLHKSAPVGTIVTIKNQENGNTVLVRVIGTLPDTGPNAGLLVKVSRKAFEKLMPQSKRFPVEVSYLAE